MITMEDVEHISWLASINIADQEKEEFLDQLGSVLEYFQQLDEVETKDVEPTYRVVDLANIFRDDIPGESLDQEESLSNAPRKEDGYFKSPRIV
jgi:aspartyl-tRNA(Asn)/glutamyl-tRNA(Gln) amidotransferase subunit C